MPRSCLAQLKLTNGLHPMSVKRLKHTCKKKRKKMNGIDDDNILHSPQHLPLDRAKILQLFIEVESL